tara:strand:- start:1916 stop:2185 length:270 start_codon:yes stop_codon:yes gene_type:complete
MLTDALIHSLMTEAGCGGALTPSVRRFAQACAAAGRAMPADARWYALDRDGVATLCANEDDAQRTADESRAAFPRNAPYRAVQMAPVAP